MTRARAGRQIVAGVLLVCAVFGGAASAQTAKAPAKVLTLEDAINYALQNYPQVRVALAQVSAADSGVSLAKTTYLPRADMLWQVNRATRNNVFGLLLPQSVISPISGPVLPTATNDSVWGNAAGLLVRWEPYDFGRRSASVKAARSGQNVANSQLSLTQLDVAVAVTNAFFTAAAAQQKATAAKADVERRQLLANAIHVLVKNDLRPGAEASRADAELARAQVFLIQAEQQDRVSRIVLAQLLGIAGTDPQIDASALAGTPPQIDRPTSVVSTHPLVAMEQSKIGQITAEEKVLDRSYYPRFDLESTVYGRGTGANADGTIQGGTGGLDFDRSNWAVGFTATFPLFDIFSIRAEKQTARANENAERQRYQQVVNDLTGQVQQAKAILDSARLIAEKTPIELQAARDTESRARARYDAGLTNIIEVADAQSLLVQAEIDDALARLAVWNDLASVDAAQGSLQPFLETVRQNHSGGH